MNNGPVYVFTLWLLCVAVSSGTLVVDQSQESSTLGQVIFTDPFLARWQEFTPVYNNVAQIDLRIFRDTSVNSADINVALTDGSNELWSGTIPNSSIPILFNWVSISTGTPVSVTPGQTYRIELTSEWDGKRLNWMGRTNSSYTAGISDNGSDFDYAFRTLAEIPEPMTLSLLAIGGLFLRRKYG